MTFSGESRRLTGVPMSFQSFAAFSFTVAMGVSFIASSATSPNRSDFPPLVMTPLATVQLAGATFQRAAAARTSISRAVAPTVR